MKPVSGLPHFVALILQGICFQLKLIQVLNN